MSVTVDKEKSLGGIGFSFILAITIRLGCFKDFKKEDEGMTELISTLSVWRILQTGSFLGEKKRKIALFQQKKRAKNGQN